MHKVVRNKFQEQKHEIIKWMQWPVFILPSKMYNTTTMYNNKNPFFMIHSTPKIGFFVAFTFLLF